MQQLFWSKQTYNFDPKSTPLLSEGQSLTYLPSECSFIFLGGLQTGFENLYFLDKNLKFNKKTLEGKVPGKRMYHCTWLQENQQQGPLLFVYGGLQDGKTLSDLFVLKIQNMTWKRFFSLESPTPKIHQAFAGKEKCFFIGGSSMPENLLSNEVWMLSTENVFWNTNQQDLSGIQWIKMTIKDDKMKSLEPIKAASAIMLNSKEIFMFGGISQSKKTLDGQILINIDKQSWKYLETKGQKPSKRAFSQILRIKEDLICLYGGITGNEDEFLTNADCQMISNEVFLFSLDQMFWQRPQIGGYSPPASIGSAVASDGGRLIVFGGKNSYDWSIYQKNTYLNQKQKQEDIEVPDFFLFVMKELDMQNNEAYIEKSYGPVEQYANGNEIFMADKIITEQKKQIMEKELELKKIVDENARIQAKQNQIQKQILQGQQQLNQETVQFAKQIQELNVKNSANQSLIAKRRRRKIEQIRSLALQSLFRKSESHLIEMDKLFVTSLKEDTLFGIISDDVINQISNHKAQHKDLLLRFKQEYEDIFKRESQIRKELKMKKETLKKYVDYSELCKKLTPENEKKLINRALL